MDGATEVVAADMVPVAAAVDMSMTITHLLLHLTNAVKKDRCLHHTTIVTSMVLADTTTVLLLQTPRTDAEAHSTVRSKVRPLLAVNFPSGDPARHPLLTNMDMSVVVVRDHHHMNMGTATAMAIDRAHLPVKEDKDLMVLIVAVEALVDTVDEEALKDPAVAVKDLATWADHSIWAD